jgi:phosphatidylserine/phosphatidylglycerophosphate/cardiolipin synthase-like enzyme
LENDLILKIKTSFLKSSALWLPLGIISVDQGFTNPYFPNLQNPFSIDCVGDLIPKKWPKEGLIVFPDHGKKVLLEAIKKAKSTLDIAAYKLSDPDIIEALLRASQERNIKVNLLIEPKVYLHDKTLDLETPFKKLRAGGIQIFYTPPRFNQSHYKMLVIDKKWGLMSTGNFDQESFEGIKNGDAPCRDFAMTITDPRLIEEMLTLLTADIENQRIVLKESQQLVVGPEHQRMTFLKMINCATLK